MTTSKVIVTFFAREGRDRSTGKYRVFYEIQVDQILRVESCSRVSSHVIVRCDEEGKANSSWLRGKRDGEIRFHVLGDYTDVKTHIVMVAKRHGIVLPFKT